MQMTKKERRSETDNRIKEAAIEVFAEYGYERAKLSDIAKRAGISIGLIGQNFGSKQELFMGIVKDGYANLHNVFDGIGKDEPWEKYLKGLIDYFVMNENDPEMKKRLAFLSNVANSKDTPPCYLEESLKELELTPVANALRKGQQQGQVKEGHVGILYAIFFRTVCNVVATGNKYGIEIPPDEWFLTLLRRGGE